MAYQPEFLTETWAAYLAEQGCAPEQVDPDAFIRWAYARALAHREPRYRAMEKWGITVTAEQVAALRDTPDFIEMVARAIGAAA